MINTALRNNISENIANPAVQSANRKGTTAGIIIKADEKSNRCEVSFFDTRGRKASAKDCMVDLRNGSTGWFPKIGDKIVFMSDGHGSGTVLSLYTDNYEKDIKSKTKIKNDILNNGDPGLCGGEII